MSDSLQDERFENPDEDIPTDPRATLPAAAVQNPQATPVAAATDLEPEDVEPQTRAHPDNDGETVQQ